MEREQFANLIMEALEKEEAGAGCRQANGLGHQPGDPQT